MEVLYPRCAGLDVHKATVVAAVRLAAGGRVGREVRTFATTTAGLLGLAAWLAENGCTHVAMEATGVYWRPVWHVLAEGGFVLVLAMADLLQAVRSGDQQPASFAVLVFFSCPPEVVRPAGDETGVEWRGAAGTEVGPRLGAREPVF